MDTIYFNKDTFELCGEPEEGCIYVDTPIAEAIKVLNTKGYITSACCCGHADMLPDECAYIQFDFGEITPETLPAGWFWTDNGQQMEYEYMSQDADRFNIEKIEVMNALLSWAKTLPDVR